MAGHGRGTWERRESGESVRSQSMDSIESGKSIHNAEGRQRALSVALGNGGQTEGSHGFAAMPQHSHQPKRHAGGMPMLGPMKHLLAKQSHIRTNNIQQQQHRAIVEKARREKEADEKRRQELELEHRRHQFAMLDAVIIAATEKMHAEQRKKEKEKEERQNKLEGRGRKGKSKKQVNMKAGTKAMMFTTKAPQAYEHLPILENSKSLAGVCGFKSRGGFML
uniref:Uncharacterized protein n=1 Tax=Hemiselmis andersenii TaxID=464988 RepID=A0A6T8MBX7_HEMAN